MLNAPDRLVLYFLLFSHVLFIGLVVGSVVQRVRFGLPFSAHRMVVSAVMEAIAVEGDDTKEVVGMLLS